MGSSFAGIETLSVEDMPKDYGRWMLHGPQGSGKTTLASTIAELGDAKRRTLYIDLVGEKGVRSFQGAPYAKFIDVARPKSVTALDDVFWALNKGDHPYQAVVVDSLTAVQKMSMRFILGHDETAVREIRQGTAPADQRSWGQTLDIMQDTATFWYGLADGERARPMHVVMICQTKQTENEFTGEVSLTPDVQRGALSIALASPDYILYTDLEDDVENVSDDGTIPQRHVVRFGASTKHRTKSRVPVNLRGKVPSVLGRGKSSPNLATLSRVLDIGGASAQTKESK